MSCIDLFAGCGGWDLGARELGIDPIGIEWMPEACDTRSAAGLRTIRADLSSYPPPRSEVDLLIASPPCQDFSVAGKRAGRTGDRGQLTDVVPRWVEALMPRAVVCEQVPPVLPIWVEHGEHYRRLGFRVWCGVLNAADYGVPQTRKRAILIARRDGRPALPPMPTHGEVSAPVLFGEPVLPWVSMFDACGWGPRCGPSPTISPGKDVDGGNFYREGLWAAIVAEGQEADLDSVRLAITDALALQTFPPGYPMRGSMTRQFIQVGNAVPPMLARAILSAAVPEGEQTP